MGKIDFSKFKKEYDLQVKEMIQQIENDSELNSIPLPDAERRRMLLNDFRDRINEQETYAIIGEDAEELAKFRIYKQRKERLKSYSKRLAIAACIIISSAVLFASVDITAARRFIKTIIESYFDSTHIRFGTNQPGENKEEMEALRDINAAGYRAISINDNWVYEYTNMSIYSNHAEIIYNGGDILVEIYTEPQVIDYPLHSTVHMPMYNKYADVLEAGDILIATIAHDDFFYLIAANLTYDELIELIENTTFR